VAHDALKSFNHNLSLKKMNDYAEESRKAKALGKYIKNSEKPERNSPV